MASPRDTIDLLCRVCGCCWGQSLLKERRIPDGGKHFGILRGIEGVKGLPQVHFLAGLLQGALDRVEKELVLMDNVVKLDPGYAIAWHRIGELAGRLGKADKASEAMTRYRDLVRRK